MDDGSWQQQQACSRDARSRDGRPGQPSLTWWRTSVSAICRVATFWYAVHSMISPCAATASHAAATADMSLVFPVPGGPMVAARGDVMISSHAIRCDSFRLPPMCLTLGNWEAIL